VLSLESVYWFCRRVSIFLPQPLQQPRAKITFRLICIKALINLSFLYWGISNWNFVYHLFIYQRRIKQNWSKSDRFKVSWVCDVENDCDSEMMKRKYATANKIWSKSYLLLVQEDETYNFRNNDESICDALMMITGVIETSATCRWHRFHW